VAQRKSAVLDKAKVAAPCRGYPVASGDEAA